MNANIAALRKSLTDKTLRLSKKAELDAAQLALLAALVQTSTPNGSPPPAKVKGFTKADMHTAATKLQELGWITIAAKGDAVVVGLLGGHDHHDVRAEAVAARIKLPEVEVVVEAAKPIAKVVKPAAVSTPKDPNVISLNWAFRRLRRQCTIFYGGNDKDKQAELRKDLENVEESYNALRRQFEGDNNKLGAIARVEGRGFDDFLEWFFGHEIHPGSRAETAAE
jgi:hypothetical protein